MPIDNDVTAVIETQIEMVKQLPERENPHRYLFPSPATERIGLPVTPGTISNALNAFVERACIFGPDGQPFRIQAHAFRHSKAVELINNGMSAVLVQHWLAHLSWDMTMVYARIREQTLQHEWRQTVARGVLRLSDSGPKIVDPEEIVAPPERDRAGLHSLQPGRDAHGERVLLQAAQDGLPVCGYALLHLPELRNYRRVLAGVQADGG